MGGGGRRGWGCQGRVGKVATLIREPATGNLEADNRPYRGGGYQAAEDSAQNGCGKRRFIGMSLRRQGRWSRGEAAALVLVAGLITNAAFKRASSACVESGLMVPFEV